jgi:murein DD-endopeptidase MepM/ murein hydrolase activator NlpD
MALIGLLAACAALAGGCRSANPLPVAQTSTRAAATAETAIPTAGIAAAQPVTATQSLAAPVSAGLAALDPLETALPGEPVRFVFPTPQPPPVSAWRPPLYPAPWALTPEDHFYFARPIAADEINWPLADYRYGGVFLPEVVHSGIDIPAPRGTPVLAAGGGRVVWAGYGLFNGRADPNDPYGLAVAIRHDFGYQGQLLYTVYGHMERVDVIKNQQVEPGEQIGLVGETGRTTGPHLHFEVRIGENTFSETRNPELWLAPPIGWGVLAGRVLGSGGLPLESYLVTVQTKAGTRYWEVKTYGPGKANPDPYYQENVVLGDLPAGEYIIWIDFAGKIYNLDVTIRPGMVTDFTFRGRRGYTLDATPPAPPVFATPAPQTSP